ncbi:hypothetical protein STRTUCAR8_04203 [Streptomyces turgidiscabies Car8]|uniref:MHYT domain-containing protein n=1 Tax=Streptomyces turgidiscabies (strain Car8) TaxID=698760 RepID=L7FAD9_STRT8|nr:hypothetical protein STRTUCAR8_04203 [Streptomyces turgidiscabies Car8]GAQ72426.1 hypothetical protein T45_04174 [Streptomyces turgidiscabies]
MILSVVIAVAAATAALWAAVSIHTLWASLGASLVMGVAVTGMHYTGMAAVSVHLTGVAETTQSSTDLLSFLLAMLAGPLTVLLISAVIVMFDPDMMINGDDWDRAAPTPQGAGTGTAQQVRRPSRRG